MRRRTTTMTLPAILLNASFRPISQQLLLLLSILTKDLLLLPHLLHNLLRSLFPIAQLEVPFPFQQLLGFGPCAVQDNLFLRGHLLLVGFLFALHLFLELILGRFHLVELLDPAVDDVEVPVPLSHQGLLKLLDLAFISMGVKLETLNLASELPNDLRSVPELTLVGPPLDLFGSFLNFLDLFEWLLHLLLFQLVVAQRGLLDPLVDLLVAKRFSRNGFAFTRMHRAIKVVMPFETRRVKVLLSLRLIVGVRGNVQRFLRWFFFLLHLVLILIT